jgi:hypothetical protein
MNCDCHCRSAQPFTYFKTAPFPRSSQDDVRQVRGLSVLTSLLSSLLRPGIADIYQLRVSVCMAV